MDSSHTMETLYAWFDAPDLLDGQWLAAPTATTKPKIQKKKTKGGKHRKTSRATTKVVNKTDGVSFPGPNSDQERTGLVLPYTVVMMMYNMLRADNTVLFVAIEHDDKEIVEKCIKKKVDVNLRDTYGRTPLMYALESDQPNTSGIISSLTTAGCNVNLTSKANVSSLPSKVSNEVNGAEVSPLMVAVRSGDPARVKLLTDAGANPDVIEPYFFLHHDGRQVHQATGTPLDCALKMWSMSSKDDHAKKIVKALLKAGADVNLKSETQSPLALAVEWQNRAAVKLLVEAGARPDPGGDERESDTDTSVLRNDGLQKWDTYSPSTEDAEIAPAGFDTPLGRAVKWWHESCDDESRKIVLALLDAGADPRRTQFPVPDSAPDTRKRSRD